MSHRYVLLSMFVLLADLMFSFHPAVANSNETPDLAKVLQNLLFFLSFLLLLSHCVRSGTVMSNIFYINSFFTGKMWTVEDETLR